MATQATTAVQCRCCGAKGRSVKPVTLRGLLQNDSVDQISDTPYRFCESKDCDVVYFAENTGQTFTKNQVKVAVGVKETTGERPLCYCFSHSVATIKEEILAKGTSTAQEDIRAKMIDPGCHCETANPSGACCLGSVANGVKIANAELGTNATAPQKTTNRAETISKVGTLISAVVASSCCWLPLLLIAVGVSSAGIASTLETYRPIFITVTFGFLASAFYFTYRTKRAADNCCAADCCETPAKTIGRMSMIGFNKLMLWVVTAFAIVFLLFPSYVGFLIGGADQTPVTSEMNQTVIKIQGMTCEACSVFVVESVRKVSGVVAVEIDYESGQGTVGTEAGKPIPEQEILDAVEVAGFKATFVSGE